MTSEKILHHSDEKIGAKVLKEIGRLVALDVITNNSDRLPLVWPNQGNISNVMFAERGPTVISIDAKIIPIDSDKRKDLYDVYAKRVCEVLQVTTSVIILLF